MNSVSTILRNRIRNQAYIEARQSVPYWIVFSNSMDRISNQAPLVLIINTICSEILSPRYI